MILTHFICLGFFGPRGLPLDQVKKRHSKRYEIVINNVKFIGRSVAELEEKVAAWRLAHPANPPIVAKIAAPKAKKPPLRVIEAVPPSEPVAVEVGQPPTEPPITPEQIAAVAVGLAAQEARRIEEEAERASRLLEQQTRLAETLRIAAEQDAEDFEVLLVLLGDIVPEEVLEVLRMVA